MNGGFIKRAPPNLAIAYGGATDEARENGKTSLRQNRASQAAFEQAHPEMKKKKSGKGQSIYSGRNGLGRVRKKQIPTPAVNSVFKMGGTPQNNED